MIDERTIEQVLDRADIVDVIGRYVDLKKKGAANVLITLGDAGAFFQGESEAYYCPSVPDITAVDPTAAGDSFIGAFGWSICSGHGIAEAMKFANEAAALTVMTVGAMPSLPTRDQVQRFVQERRSGGCAEWTRRKADPERKKLLW